jgi:two-component system cell cycle sensor histidine kinase/response regulator CckA
MSRLLVVDDEPVIRDVLRRLLERSGRIIEVAAGADDALALARSHTLDVALIDKNLIGASGLDLARQLKQLQPDLEVILLTGYASLESAIEAVQIGAFDYLQKPIDDYSTLEMKVRSAEEKAALQRGQRVLVQKLMESELRFRRLVEASPDALLLCDAESRRILDANPAAVALYGYGPDELVHMRLDTLRPYAPDPATPWAQPAQVELELHRRRDGAEILVEVTTTELTLEGRAIRILSSRDVAERERARGEKAELEERLRVAQKMEAVGRLAGGVAHDFNNLLAVIQAHAEFLGSQIAPGTEAADDLNGIVGASARGAALTRQLLLFSRHKPIELARIDVNAVVAEVRKLVTRVIGPPVRHATQLEPELWPVRADADQLAQVVLNLAVNARDAMPDGGRLLISTSNVVLQARLLARGGNLPAGRYASIVVEDQGKGMDAEVLARLFEPFFTTKEPGKGTGLGLATVYGIVHSVGGAVDVRSEPGKGSVFTVYLPATDVEADSVPPQPVSPQRGRGETILLVEDEERLRVLVRRILSSNGYNVVEAANGKDALHASADQAGRIDLVVTDIVMPELSGEQLALSLRIARPGMRVIFMTGFTDRALPELGATVGFLQKPFAASALLSEVRRLLDR